VSRPQIAVFDEVKEGIGYHRAPIPTVPSITNLVGKIELEKARGEATGAD